MSCIGCLYRSAWYTSFVSPPTKPSTALHPATLLLCACLRQRTRLVYAYVLLTHVSYFSRGPKLSSESGPWRMRELGHGTICRSPCKHQQPPPGSSRPLKHIFLLLLPDLLNIINYCSFISLMPLQFGQIFHQLLSLFHANLFCRLR